MIASSISQPATGPTAQRAANPAVEQIGKVALVSHNYNVPDSRGLYDYSEHFAQITKLCDEQSCDTVVYALYTWDRDSPVVRTNDAIFTGLDHIQRVILEVGQMRAPGRNKSTDHVEVWFRGRQDPLKAYQRFAKGDDPRARKQEFMDDLPSRRVADGLLMLCGESNIAKMEHHSDFNDSCGFTDRLKEMNIGPILNPIHDHMTRYEMNMKREHYSLGGRTVISVWNEGLGRDASQPWTVFHDGMKWTEAVRELPTPFCDRPDTRIGVVDLAWL
jgi:hypothetical protein